MTSMRYLLILMFSFLVTSSFGQLKLIGYILDEDEVGHAGAELHLYGVDCKSETRTSPSGFFEFESLDIGTYQLNVITAYAVVRKEIRLKTSAELVITVPRSITIDEVVVRSVRVDDNQPFTYTDIKKEEFQSNNLGQDVPFILKWSPSTVVTSDAGTGIGYTGIRIRGSDPTRTNVTINGIPLNDAESQAVFWVDLPDLLSSTKSIQIQRGVGTSTNGAGSFGSSINISTTDLSLEPYAEISGGLGSFNTHKTSIRAGSGLIKERWSFDARASGIFSDGYIDRATANLKSLYASAALFGH